MRRLVGAAALLRHAIVLRPAASRAQHGHRTVGPQRRRRRRRRGAAGRRAHALEHGWRLPGARDRHSRSGLSASQAVNLVSTVVQLEPQLRALKAEEVALDERGARVVLEPVQLGSSTVALGAHALELALECGLARRARVELTCVRVLLRISAPLELLAQELELSLFREVRRLLLHELALQPLVLAGLRCAQLERGLKLTREGRARAQPAQRRTARRLAYRGERLVVLVLRSAQRVRLCERFGVLVCGDACLRLFALPHHRRRLAWHPRPRHPPLDRAHSNRGHRARAPVSAAAQRVAQREGEHIADLDASSAAAAHPHAPAHREQRRRLPRAPDALHARERRRADPLAHGAVL
mmetsp:Transcript_9666/g.25009  ORF Transcript_9666/g.25009 Transcript_9666/m.25009 type:complete len:354 (-) Transcript_9666:730-1791(-)